jgi:hypothetical protein
VGLVCKRVVYGMNIRECYEAETPGSSRYRVLHDNGILHCAVDSKIFSQFIYEKEALKPRRIVRRIIVIAQLEAVGETSRVIGN